MFETALKIPPRFYKHLYEKNSKLSQAPLGSIVGFMDSSPHNTVDYWLRIIAVGSLLLARQLQWLCWFARLLILLKSPPSIGVLKKDAREHGHIQKKELGQNGMLFPPHVSLL